MRNQTPEEILHHVLNTTAVVVAQKVLTDIHEHPGTVRNQIAERTGLDPRTITMAVGTLKKRKKLISVGQKRGTRWFDREVFEALMRNQVRIK